MRSVKTKLPAYLQASIAVFACYISGCSTQMLAQPATEQVKKAAVLETIYDAKINKDSIQYTVKSTGCTNKDNFKLVIKDTESDGANVSLIRIKKDLCRAMPKLVAVEFAINSDLYNADNLTIKNPVGVKSFSRKKR